MPHTNPKTAEGSGKLIKLADKLKEEHSLSKEEWVTLISERDGPTARYIFENARELKKKYYGNDIYVRGLIEVTNYCKNDCLYCGIRRSNKNAERYRLTDEEILQCTDIGYELGYRTFVLQGGEDPYYSDEHTARIIKNIKLSHPDCAVTLSLGEREYDTYKLWFDAGADRYLLRHETADETHYGMLHPPELSGEHRKKCLMNLKSIGYQTGTGFMVGSPHQRPEHLAEDMLFIEKLQPAMVGIGPFIPHHDTPFASEPAGTVELTLYMLGLLRLMLPAALLPATTALSTIDETGREKGVEAGANVVMPNLSPLEVRKKYELYDNKACTGEEAAECSSCLKLRMMSVGQNIVISRGDAVKPIITRL